jgi:phosphoserine phosphatase
MIMLAMKLLVLDVEGTLFKTTVRIPDTHFDSTIWQGIAQILGPGAVNEEVETHRRWELGSYRSYLDWMKDTISIHMRWGLTERQFQKLVSSAEYNPHVLDTLSKLDRAEYEPLLISGGFRELAIRAQRDLKIIHAFAACEYLFSKDGRLETYNLLPCDFDSKINFIQLMIHEYDLGPYDWIYVGDGRNDVPVARIAPLSIGYRPHPDLKSVVSRSIDDFRDLLEILSKYDHSEAPKGN